LTYPDTAYRPIVLVVEDEPILRMGAVDMVEDAGFIAVEATDATDAIRILESRPDIRIVFSDIDMPRGIDGMKLAAAIRERWPPIHIILTSGHFHARDIKLPVDAVFFAKPYDESRVVAQLRRMSAEERAGAN
jgi:CheY-like chemotaxis protein